MSPSGPQAQTAGFQDSASGHTQTCDLAKRANTDDDLYTKLNGIEWNRME